MEAPEKGYNCLGAQEESFEARISLGDLGFDKWEINWDANQQAWCCK